MLQPERVDHARLVRREHAEVRIRPARDPALAGQPRQRRGPRRHPCHDVVQRVPARPGLRPDRRQPQLQRRDPAPRLAEVVGVEPLELRRRRRVVRYDDVDQPVGQPLPQQLPVRLLPDRRAALVLSLDVHRRRHGVQWHVDQRGDPACRRGPRGGGEALPLRAPRLVDVHVGVDQAGQQHLVHAEVDDADTGRHGRVVGLDGDDPPVVHPDPARRRAVGCDHPPGAQDRLHWLHLLRPPPRRA